MGNMQKVQVTYADLVDGDTLVDRSGNEWPVSEVEQGDPVAFWLGVPKTHHMTKPAADPVEVLRPETQATEVAQREAEVDAAAGGLTDCSNCDGSGCVTCEGSNERTPVEPTTPEAAVAEVTEQLGGEVVATETAAEAEVRKAAEAGQGPAKLPPFEAFTDLERKSHLYLLHGVYAEDLTSRADLDALHAKLHGDEKHRPVAHEHDAANPFPGDPSEQR